MQARCKNLEAAGHLGGMSREAVFEGLYRECADQVHAYVSRRAAAGDVDDVVNETFLVAWRRLDEVPERALPWLFGVARRVVANRRRSQSRLVALRRRLLAQPTQALVTEADAVVDLQVRHALAGLGERDRELLMLIAWEGLGMEETAEALGIRTATLSVRLHRARRRLAQALTAEGVKLDLEVKG